MSDATEKETLGFQTEAKQLLQLILFLNLYKYFLVRLGITFDYIHRVVL